MKLVQALSIMDNAPLDPDGIEHNTMENLINKIYDDKKKEICKYCKHYKEDKIFENTKLDCSANAYGQNIISFPPMDFGCNRFEELTCI